MPAKANQRVGNQQPKISSKDISIKSKFILYVFVSAGQKYSAFAVSIGKIPNFFVFVFQVRIWDLRKFHSIGKLSGGHQAKQLINSCLKNIYFVRVIIYLYCHRLYSNLQQPGFRSRPLSGRLQVFVSRLRNCFKKCLKITFNMCL